ncbi:MAG: polyprenyl synthetase family protein [Candidatus Stahlbacteria bacterium]|nr:MAG: polyprenyl synthetase family protein [Candidatus Stahlbacteria bacterium]
MKDIDIVKYLAEKKALVDEALKNYFANTNSLFEIMHYSIDRGKRIRPILAIMSFDANGGEDMNIILPVACGLELIHTYSLIHDDLPSMDNDDFRRGKASAHKKFGEAMAILSGDGLFAYAFELFTQGNGLIQEKYSVIKSVSEAVGPKGIVFGQSLDINNEIDATPKSLRRIHVNKTAKFIAVSIKCGAIMARAPEHIIDKSYNAGLYMGILFQYTDDILDIIGEKKKLGKTPGKDVAFGKLTAPAIYGLEGAKFRAERYAELAKTGFSALGERFRILNQITDFILNRTF